MTAKAFVKFYMKETVDMLLSGKEPITLNLIRFLVFYN